MNVNCTTVRNTPMAAFFIEVAETGCYDFHGKVSYAYFTRFLEKHCPTFNPQFGMRTQEHIEKLYILAAIANEE